jgi:type IV pilus assembly protein PilC
MGTDGLHGYLMKAAGTLAWLYVPGAVILGVVYFTPNTGILRRSLDYAILRIPVLRRAVRHLSLSRYCQAFYLLIKAGVPAVQCAQKATEMTGNAGIADMLKGSIESVRVGRLFSEGFSDKLPLEFRESWQVGEETGDLDDVAQRLAQSTAEKAEWTFEQLAFWLPRLIYFGILILMAIRVFQGYAAIGYSVPL